MAIKRSSDSPDPQQPRKTNIAKQLNYEVTLLSPQANTQETEQNEAKIRPQKLVDYIGQKKT